MAAHHASETGAPGHDDKRNINDDHKHNGDKSIMIIPTNSSPESTTQSRPLIDVLDPPCFPHLGSTRPWIYVDDDNDNQITTTTKQLQGCQYRRADITSMGNTPICSKRLSNSTTNRTTTTTTNKHRRQTRMRMVCFPHICVAFGSFYAATSFRPL